MLLIPRDKTSLNSNPDYEEFDFNIFVLKPIRYPTLVDSGGKLLCTL